MKCEVLNIDNYRIMPWKNSLGSTCEMMRVPYDDNQPFIWRLSIADISEEKSAFSLFNGYLRIINTLQGQGMRLMVDAKPSRDLLAFDPFIFSGDSQVESELIDGPIKDFNLIFNPEKCSVRLQWSNFQTGGIFCSQAKDILVYSCEECRVSVDQYAYELAHQSLFHAHNESSKLARFAVDSHLPQGHYCVIEIN